MNSENQNLIANAQIIHSLSQIKGSSFVGIKNYSNRYGEVANHTIALSTPLKPTIQKDFELLTSISTMRKVVSLYNSPLKQWKRKSGNFTQVTQKVSKEVVKKAYNELVNSYSTRVKKDADKKALLKKGKKDYNSLNETEQKEFNVLLNSESQINAYNHIKPGLKFKDGILYVTGKTINKKVVKPAPKKNPTCSSLKTITKKIIESEIKTRMSKYRNFKLNMDESLKIRGNEIVRSL